MIGDKIKIGSTLVWVQNNDRSFNKGDKCFLVGRRVTKQGRIEIKVDPYTPKEMGFYDVWRPSFGFVFESGPSKFRKMRIDKVLDTIS